MRLASVKEDDIVRVDIRGRRFYALVVAKQDRRLSIQPLDNRISYHAASSREVIDHWRKASRRQAT